IAVEGRVFVLGPCMCLRTSDIPDRLGLKERFYAGAGEWINVGVSAIANPNGELVAGPSREKEEILYAEIDPRILRGPRWMLDVAGHYARPDVFSLTVNTEAPSFITLQPAPPTTSVDHREADITRNHQDTKDANETKKTER